MDAHSGSGDSPPANKRGSCYLWRALECEFPLGKNLGSLLLGKVGLHISWDNLICWRGRAEFVEKLLIMTYLFLDKNSREPPLNIPNVARLGVGTVYSI